MNLGMKYAGVTALVYGTKIAGVKGMPCHPDRVRRNYCTVRFLESDVDLGPFLDLAIPRNPWNECARRPPKKTTEDYTQSRTEARPDPKTETAPRD